ncbi:MAG TPA: transcription-repair coupling factor [Candidatus Hydrogenedens sp.]|nr:transcription-repair coupling factor [Candidatus Hydrogenedens sp.]
MAISLKEFEIIHKLAQGFHHTNYIQVSGPWGTGKSVIAYLLSSALNTPLFIIAPDNQSAEDIYEDFVTLSSEETCALFPPWETMPTDIIDPAEDIVSERLHLLTRIISGKQKPKIIISTIRSVLQIVPPVQSLERQRIHLQTEQEYSLEELTHLLVASGYQREASVSQHGEFSRRGGILDIFPYGHELPVRLEFFADTIESIREFDPETQKSIAPIDFVDIILKTEKDLLREKITLKEKTWILDYLPTDTLIVWDEPLNIFSEGEKIESEFTENPYLFSLEELKEKCSTFKNIEIASLSLPERNVAQRIIIPMNSVQMWAGNLSQFWEQLKQWDIEHYQVRLLCNTPAEQLRMHELVTEQGYRLDKDPFDLKIELGKIRAGFIYPDEKLVVISERELFGRKYVRRKGRFFRRGSRIYSLTDLKPGDFVVHETHGIGKFAGLYRFSDKPADYLSIIYRDGDRLYIPVTQLDQIRKYIAGEGATPNLDKMGGKTWNKTKEKVRESVKQFAEELLKLYAKRHHSKGFAFSADTPWQRQMEESFDYEETPDQYRAIEEVKRDMEDPKPMDRLICGDVGFGKTEVAIRASFKAVMDGKQVAVLAPTTVLVHQHWHTFQERMAGFPIRIEALSRLRTTKQIKDVLKGLMTGEVDIVIGTHRLLSKDVQFKDLGLLIIDEEQRFGVRHKEQLKKLREHVDSLTLTATPIPRTLQFCLSGIRDMSVINTAPNDRLPIHTCITHASPEVIKEAIERELRREGQVYYLHNRVQTIEYTAKKLQQWVPHARIGIGHGQMSKNELERIMTAFINREIDVLVCTTIIASGIDIPNVNTIIVDRADRFGLSELYQIRGRVGRYKHRAFAYLLIPSDKSLTKEAQERLKAIQDFSVLGSGLQVALKDLEIRGAGDLLGPEQSGHINAVGFDTYRELIEEVIAEMKGQPIIRKKLPPLEGNINARIPDDFITDSLQRMQWYQRISSVQTPEECQELIEELRDRYGAIPECTENLINVMKARVLAHDLGVKRIIVNKKVLHIIFDTYHPITPIRKKIALEIFKTEISTGWEEYPYLEVTTDDNLENHLHLLILYLEKLHKEGV